MVFARIWAYGVQCVISGEAAAVYLPPLSVLYIHLLTSETARLGCSTELHSRGSVVAFCSVSDDCPLDNASFWSAGFLPFAAFTAATAVFPLRECSPPGHSSEREQGLPFPLPLLFFPLAQSLLSQSETPGKLEPEKLPRAESTLSSQFSKTLAHRCYCLVLVPRELPFPKANMYVLSSQNQISKA